MANITVNNLSTFNIVGADLFNDAESFMTELSDENEEIRVIGGCLMRSDQPLGCATPSIFQCRAPSCLVSILDHTVVYEN